jgi:hypothetical protein
MTQQRRWYARAACRLCRAAADSGNAGVRWPRLRPLAFAVGYSCRPHTVYYALFLVYPDVLDAAQTMLFSIILRYQMLFTTAAYW